MKGKLILETKDGPLEREFTLPERGGITRYVEGGDRDGRFLSYNYLRDALVLMLAEIGIEDGFYKIKRQD